MILLHVLYKTHKSKTKIRISLPMTTTPEIEATAPENLLPLFCVFFTVLFDLVHLWFEVLKSLFLEFDKETGDVVCNGIKSVIKEGYKSFPSGHTSWSFAGLGFLSWYLSGKVRVFDRRGHIGKFSIVLLPLLIAALIGVTRVDDYWHHWTDVFTGGLIGIVVSSSCYLLLFPFPTFAHGWAPHAFFYMLEEGESSQTDSQTPSLVRREDFSSELDEMESGKRYI